jgi:hypothetical protein
MTFTDMVHVAPSNGHEDIWRAGCDESRTSGSGEGRRKRGASHLASGLSYAPTNINATPTATPTATATPLPTSCSPRPRVEVTASPDGPGRLRVTVRARTSAGTPTNQLQRLRFGAATNALVDVGDQRDRSGDFTLDLPDRPSEITFIVRRAVGGQATTVLFAVVDNCGEFPTFVGGGPTAF